MSPCPPDGGEVATAVCWDLAKVAVSSLSLSLSPLQSCTIATIPSLCRTDQILEALGLLSLSHVS